MNNDFINLKYDYESHTFDKGVILAYNNAIKNPVEIRDSFIKVKQQRKTTVFLLKGKCYVIPEKTKIFSEYEDIFVKKKVNEVCYDLDEIFKNPTKEVRRGINLLQRKDIQFSDNYKVSDIEYLRSVNNIFKSWKLHKEADPKVYRMTFNPNRYLRCFSVKHFLPDTFQGVYSVNNQPYGVIIFTKHPTKPIAYELAFVSKFFDKKLKVINDLNFCVLINAFSQLYNQGIQIINVGPDGGIKGLKTFKEKLPYYYNTIYSN